MFKLISFVIFSITIFFISPTDTVELDRITAGEAPGTIQFIGDAGGENVFTVEKWAFTTIENLETPTQMHLEAVLDIRSISCSWEELNMNVKEKKDYFFMKKFPEASITINGAKEIEPGKYTTEAMLTLKGITKPVTLNFTMSAAAPYQVKATGIIIRQEFKFKGKGPKNEVPVMIEAILQ